jgi:hypothetical protein
MKLTRSALIPVVAAIVTAVVGWAQAAPPPEGGAEEAEHGVARISVMQGEVSVRHGDAGELSAAALNAPVLATDRVATGANSRAEVQFDAVNMIRLAPSSEVRVGDLQYKRYLVQIAQGTTSFRVLRATSGANDTQVEISTPSISVRPLGQGTYRVAVTPEGTSEITVRNGEAEVFSPKGAERLRAGQTMVARGDPSDPEFQINGAVPFDEFDQWNTQRDGELVRYTSSSRNVSPDIYGTEELDQNGRWVNDPAYGNVWVPTVAPGWAPYRVGRWVYEDYYGWTWLSGDPWGWAPYHWGRWYQGSFGWAWWPGAFGPRYYWRPALVGFFGWGGGVGFGVGFGGGFGFGHVGWVPLAPFETFRPWYGRGYGGGAGIVNNVNIVNNYRNARFVNGANGVTGMRANEFGRGAVNSSNFVRASEGDLRGAGSIQGRMPVAPVRESMRMSERPVNTAGMPAANANQRFAGRSSFGPTTAGGGNGPGGRTFAGGAGVPAGSSNGAASNGGWTRMSPRGTPGGGQIPAGQGGVGQSPVTEGRTANRGGTGVANGGGGWRGFNPGSGGAGPGAAGAGATGAGGSIAPRNTPGNNGGSFAGTAGAPRNEAPRFNGSNGGGPNGGAAGAVEPRGGYSAPPNRGFTPQQQPVRISPPIVSNRGASGGGGGARPDVHSGFGGAHSGGGGGGGNRGGGGGGNRGGGGGGGGHRGR